MRSLGTIQRKIGSILWAIFALAFTYFACYFSVIVISYPPSRGDPLLVVGLVLSSIGLPVAFSEWKRISRTKVSKESCYFVFIVLSLVFVLLIFGNHILKLGLPNELIVTISILIASPASLLIAGYSRKTLVRRLKSLGFDQGITFATILMLTLMPILRQSVLAYAIIRASGRLAPNLVFQSTDTTSSVNGVINASGFFLDVPFYTNQTFQAHKVVELSASYLENPIDLQFTVTGLKGSFEFVDELELTVDSDSARVDLISTRNGFLYNDQSHVVLMPGSSLSLDARSVGTDFSASNGVAYLLMSVCCDDKVLQTINIALTIVT